MAELDDPCDVTRPDVARASAEYVQVGPGLGGRVRIAGHRERQPAGGRHARIAHYRSGQEPGAASR